MSAASSARWSPLFVVLLGFLFFLPMRSLEVIGSVSPTGFAINIARLLSIALAGLVLVDACGGGAPFKSPSGSWTVVERAVHWFLLAMAASILYYYFLVALGQTELFGVTEPFFRNWQGRPLAQAISWMTYGFIPFLVTARAARDPWQRQWIVRTLCASVLVLLGYGLLQQGLFAVGLPVTGRNIFEVGRPITFDVNSVTLLRFHSVGGEPRDYAGFMLGGLFLYWYAHAGAMRWGRVVVLLLLALSFVWSLSLSGYMAAAGMLGVAGVDLVLRRRLHVDRRMAVGMVLAAISVVALVRSPLSAAIVDRSLVMYDNLSAFASGRAQPLSYAILQAHDLAPLYAFVQLLTVAPAHHLLFGYGFGNELTPVIGVLRDTFGLETAGNDLSDTRSLLFKIVLEMGVAGTALYLGLLVAPLWQSARVLSTMSPASLEGRRLRVLRYAYMAFFVSAAFHTSFFFLIVLGLLVRTRTRT